MLNKGKLFFIFSILILMVYPVLALECGDTITGNTIMAEDLNCTNATSTLALRVRDGAILDCANYKIIRDDVHQSSVGIWASEGSTIQNCIIRGFKTGITLASQDTNKNNNILNNTIIGTFGVDDLAGISIYNEGAENNKIINNDISGFSADWWSAGIKIYLYASNNLIERNTLHSNYQGIYLRDSRENIITENIIISNINGIRIDPGNHNSATNNLAYNNYFENNSAFNAQDSNGGNFWNITKTLGTNIIGGPYLGGNYWNSYDWNGYKGEDLDSIDGIGDTELPYNAYGSFPIGEGDYLPLIYIEVQDSDNDGVTDSEDKCPNTEEGQIVYGCSCEQILSLKQGNNNGELKKGCSKGTIDVFTKKIGWARGLF